MRARNLSNYNGKRGELVGRAVCVKSCLVCVLNVCASECGDTIVTSHKCGILGTYVRTLARSFVSVSVVVVRVHCSILSLSIHFFRSATMENHRNQCNLLYALHCLEHDESSSSLYDTERHDRKTISIVHS